jgi:hypothetical protein
MWHTKIVQATDLNLVLKSTMDSNPSLDRLVKILLKEETDSGGAASREEFGDILNIFQELAYSPSQADLKRTLDLRQDLSEHAYDVQTILKKISTSVQEKYGFDRMIYFGFSTGEDAFLPQFATGCVTPVEQGSEIVVPPETMQEHRIAQPVDESLWQIVQGLCVPADADCVLNDVRRTRGDTLYVVGDNVKDTKWNRKIIDGLGIDTFMLAPIGGQKESVMGIWCIENAIGKEPLRIPDGYCWQDFKVTTSQGLQPAKLYEKLVSRKTREAIKANAEEWLMIYADKFRNSITTVGGFANLLKKVLPEGTAEHKRADIIVKEVQRLEELHGKMAEYVRPLEPIREPHDLAHIVASVENRLNPQSNVELIYLKPSEDYSVNVDEKLIQEAIYNVLLDNTRAFNVIRADGKIIISVNKGSNFELDGFNIPVYKEISVCNVGRNVPEEVRNKVLYPTGNEGWELVMAQKILGAHGGTIFIETNGGLTSLPEGIDYGRVDKSKRVNFRIIIPDGISTKEYLSSPQN